MSDTPKVLRGWMYESWEGFDVYEVKQKMCRDPETEVQIIPVPEHGFCIRDRVDVLDADDLVDGTYGEVCGYGYNDVIFVDLLEDPMGLGPVYPATHDELRPRKSVTEPERTYTEEQWRRAMVEVYSRRNVIVDPKEVDGVLAFMRRDS